MSAAPAARVRCRDADRIAFLNSTGAYASDALTGVTTTGLDDIDLWIGGLAEKTMPFGGMLGSTFNFVFENQLENLQNGDRLLLPGTHRGTATSSTSLRTTRSPS